MRDYTRPPTMVRFNGEDPLDWVLQVERYYFVYSISDSIKLPLASLFLEGDARRWFHNNQFRDWDDFVDQVFDHFRNWTPGSTLEDQRASAVTVEAEEIAESENDSALVEENSGSTNTSEVATEIVAPLIEVQVLDGSPQQGPSSKPSPPAPKYSLMVHLGRLDIVSDFDSSLDNGKSAEKETFPQDISSELSPITPTFPNTKVVVADGLIMPRISFQAFPAMSIRVAFYDILPRQNIVWLQHAFGLHSWVDTGQTEIAHLPWICGGNPDKQSAGMSQAFSIITKSCIAKTYVKANCVIASRQLADSSTISFPFEPGTTLRKLFDEPRNHDITNAVSQINPRLETFALKTKTIHEVFDKTVNFSSNFVHPTSLVVSLGNHYNVDILLGPKSKEEASSRNNLAAVFDNSTNSHLVQLASRNNIKSNELWSTFDTGMEYLDCSVTFANCLNGVLPTSHDVAAEYVINIESTWFALDCQECCVPHVIGQFAYTDGIIIKCLDEMHFLLSSHCHSQLRDIDFPFDPGSSSFAPFLVATRNCAFLEASLKHDLFILWSNRENLYSALLIDIALFTCSLAFASFVVFTGKHWILLPITVTAFVHWKLVDISNVVLTRCQEVHATVHDYIINSISNAGLDYYSRWVWLKNTIGRHCSQLDTRSVGEPLPGYFPVVTIYRGLCYILELIVTFLTFACSSSMTKVWDPGRQWCVNYYIGEIIGNEIGSLEISDKLLKVVKGYSDDSQVEGSKPSCFGLHSTPNGFPLVLVELWRSYSAIPGGQTFSIGFSTGYAFKSLFIRVRETKTMSYPIVQAKCIAVHAIKGLRKSWSINLVNPSFQVMINERYSGHNMVTVIGMPQSKFFDGNTCKLSLLQQAQGLNQLLCYKLDKYMLRMIVDLLQFPFDPGRNLNFSFNSKMRSSVFYFTFEP